MHAVRRSDEEIVAEALNALTPPSDKREATRSEVLTLIHSLRRFEQAGLHRQPSAGQRKEQLNTYFNNLRATKRTFFMGSDEFLTYLDAEIADIKWQHDFQVSRMPKASRPRDWVAIVAAAMAHGLIPEARATLTAGGPWHRLSMLLYEAATGKHDCDKVLKYMAEIKNRDPRVVFVKTPENMKKMIPVNVFLRSKPYLRLKRQYKLIKQAKATRLRAERRIEQLLQARWVI